MVLLQLTLGASALRLMLAACWLLQQLMRYLLLLMTMVQLLLPAIELRSLILLLLRNVLF